MKVNQFSYYCIIVFICFISVTSKINAQVSIGTFSDNTPQSDSSNIISVYENQFGIGNVYITNYADFFGVSQVDINQHDVLYLHFTSFQPNIPISFVNKLVAFFGLGKHLVISSEGAKTETGIGLAQYIWNAITGDTILESEAGLYGVLNPPKFHNSFGPARLSIHNNLVGSTTTFASFTNLKQENIIHLRAERNANCDKLFALDALYPSKPTLGTGTLYINGEWHYPFFSSNDYQEIYDLASGLAFLHKTLLNSSNSDLLYLNNQVLDSIVLTSNSSISLNETIFPNTFSPNGDQRNDVFKPIPNLLAIHTIENFRIFNRWGNEIYSTITDIIWDGKNKEGTEVSEGIYFYTLKASVANSCELNAEVMMKEINGSINLFR